MKEYFTSSSDLVRKHRRMSGGHGGVGAQGFDVHFPDSLQTTIATKGVATCYNDMNESTGPPYHSEWGKEYCHQKGGMSTRGAYKAYKKYKMKYKNLKY